MGQIVFILVIWILIEVYSLTGIRRVLEPGKVQTWIFRIALLGALLFLVGFLVSVGSSSEDAPPRGHPIRSPLIGLGMSFMLLKTVFCTLLAVNDIILAPFRIVNLFKTDSGGDGPASSRSRRYFLGRVGLGLAGLQLPAFVHGVTKGKYLFKVHRVQLASADLPEAFDGFTIAQISDIHSGSFDNKSAIQGGLERIVEEKPDMILFTGDLVNAVSEEILPYIDMFRDTLRAPFGKFSSLGNHDYPTYGDWATDKEGEADHQKLRSYHADMDFELLANRGVRIEKNGDSIFLAGVENWGLHFIKAGDLNQALKDARPDDFTVLMSHDPSHWEAQILDHPQTIHLTLSGHTHGAQMGVEVPGIRWSPSQFFYKQWAGLYQKGKQALYVNRGFGFIGFPGRVGIWPEITLIELVRE